MSNLTKLRTLTAIFVMAVTGLSPYCSAQGPNKRAPGPNKKAIQREQERAKAGVIEGAVWTFRLEPQKGSGAYGKPVVEGKFRIFNGEIFQGETPEAEFTKKIGVAKFTDKHEGTADFEKIGGYEPDKKWSELKGKATTLVQNKKGVWRGDFYDGDGFKWSMALRRYQE